MKPKIYRYCETAVNLPLIWCLNVKSSVGCFSSVAFSLYRFGKQNRGMAKMMLTIPKMRNPNHQAPIQRGSFGVMSTSKIFKFKITNVE